MSNKRLELTAIVQTYNEERNIAACLDALRWADELIVVDMESTDKTVEIAREYTDKVFSIKNAGYVEPGRQFALNQATKDWILVVDADERVSQKLKQMIIDTVLTDKKPIEFIVPDDNVHLRTSKPKGTEILLYVLPIDDYIFGRWVKYGYWGSPQQYVRRLLKKGEVSWGSEVHYVPRVPLGALSVLDGPLLHFSHLEISNFINKLNTYTSSEAQHRYEQGGKYNWPNTMVATLFQVPNIFLKGKAYHDGEHGFVLTMLMAMYTFVYRCKIWELHYKAAHPDSINQHEAVAGPEKLDQLIGPDRATISAIVQTYNEEKNIEKCLEALRWADEIILVDMESTDKTLELARQYTDKVFVIKNAGYVEAGRQFALDQTTKDWILVVDADELITEKLKQEIAHKVLARGNQNEAYGAYSVWRPDFMFGRWIDYGNSTAQIFPRLLRREKAHWSSNIHDKAQFEGLHGRLDGGLLHFSHLDIASYIKKLNKYTSYEAHEQLAKGKRHGWLNTLLASFKRFFLMYFQYKCYKYGSHGFVLSMLMFFYGFVYRAKLWELHYKAEHPDSMHEHEPLADPQKPPLEVEVF